MKPIMIRLEWFEAAVLLSGLAALIEKMDTEASETRGLQMILTSLLQRLENQVGVRHDA